MQSPRKKVSGTFFINALIFDGGTHEKVPDTFFALTPFLLADMRAVLTDLGAAERDLGQCPESLIR